jgi:LysR family glycine cleavage system transcriptional activator
LKRLPVIDFEWTNPHPDHPTWSNWFQLSGHPLHGSRALLTFSDESHAIQAAIAGQGVALLSLRLLAEDLGAGTLMQPFGPTMRGMSYHLIEGMASKRRPEVEAVRSWLFSELNSSASPEKLRS